MDESSHTYERVMSHIRAGEVPSMEWEKDFQTWEGLGGWLLVNLVSSLCTCVHMYLYMYICVYIIYIHICVYIYTCT